MEREVDFCLLGLYHDELEDRVTAALLGQTDRDDELIFFEASITEDDYHFNLESGPTKPMSFVFSLLAIHLLPQTPWEAIGTDDESVILQRFGRHFREHGISIYHYQQMNTSQRRLYLLFSQMARVFTTYIQATSVELLHWELRDFFGQNAEATEDFCALLLGIMRELPLVYNGEYARLSVTTITLVHRFARDVCELLVTRQGTLGAEIDKVALMLREFQVSGHAPLHFIDALLDAPVSVRNRTSIARVARAVFYQPQIRRVILAVGSYHIAGLEALVRENNGTEAFYLSLRFTLRQPVLAHPYYLETRETPQDPLETVLSRVSHWRASSLDTPDSPTYTRTVPLQRRYLSTH